VEKVVAPLQVNRKEILLNASGKEDSKEDFMDEIPISKALFIAFLVTLVVFGILFMINVSWMWALIIGFISGALFWYFCSD
jgi:hypothetical protein